MEDLVEFEFPGLLLVVDVAAMSVLRDVDHHMLHLSGLNGTYRVDRVDVQVLATEVGSRSSSYDDLHVLLGHWK